MQLVSLTISAVAGAAGPVPALVCYCRCVSEQCSRRLISPISSGRSSSRFDPAPREAWQDSCLREAKKTTQKHRLTSRPWSAERNINSMDLLCDSCVFVCVMATIFHVGAVFISTTRFPVWGNDLIPQPASFIQILMNELFKLKTLQMHIL